MRFYVDRISAVAALLTSLFVVSVAAQDAVIGGRITVRGQDGSLSPANVVVALVPGQDIANARYTHTSADGAYSFNAVSRDGTFMILVFLPNPNQPIFLTGLKDVKPAIRTRYDVIIEPGDFEAARKELQASPQPNKGASPQPSNEGEQIADLKASLDEVMRLVRVGTKESYQSAIAILEQMLVKVREQKDRKGEIVVLSMLGRSYTKVGERRKAIEAFEASLPIIRAQRDRDLEAVTLRNIGLTYDLVGEKQKAIANLEQAMAIWHELGDTKNESDTRQHYEEVRAGTYAAGDRVTAPPPVKGGRGDQGLTLAEEAFALMKQGTADSLRAAIRKMDEARAIFREIGDSKLESLMWGNAANIYQMLGEKDKALEYYEQELGPLRRAGDRLLEGSTLSNIAVLYDDQGDRQKALEYLNQALKILEPIGDAHSLSNLYGNFGVVYLEIGESGRGLEYAQKALALARQAKDPRLEGKALSNLAQAYSQVGQTQQAIETLRLSIPILRAAGLPAEVGLAMNNMATLYYDLGDREKALALLNEALPLLRAAGDRSGQARVMFSLGKSSFDTGNYQQALQLFQQAKSLAEAVGDRQVIAALHNGLGLTYQTMGQAQPAIENFLEALRLSREVRDRMRETNTLVNLGRLSAAANQFPQSAQFFQQAVQVAHTTGDTFIEAVALGGLAWLERQRGNLAESRRYIEAALPLFEARRKQVVSQELRASFFASVQDYYQFHIDILMRLHKEQPSRGFDALALQAGEQGRARSLLETLAEAKADIRRGVSPQLLERERSLQGQLNFRAQAQMKLLANKHTEEQAQAIAREVQTLTTELQQVEAEIKQKSPNYAALTQPQPLSLNEIQTKVLDADTLLLEYSVGDESSYLWLVSRDSITSYALPKRSEIEPVARRFYDLLTARNKRVKGETTEQWQARVVQADIDIPEAAARLSRIVLAPVAAQLGKKRLVIVADGVLQYIPFGALPLVTASSSVVNPEGYPPLVVDHELVSLPSASTLDVIRRDVAGRQPAPKTVVALADPVFGKNDERVKGNRSNDARDTPRPDSIKELELVEAAEDTGLANGELRVPRLAGSRKEAEEIVAMVPVTERKLALDFAASRDTATSSELSQYRYVHFSTHGFLDSVHPELSGIVFSLVNERGEAQDGFLRAHEVFNLKLPAELVVLSACQTGIGKEIRGEGLVSLTRGFMYAGAPRVVVSLWSVSEMGTTELMVRFYREMLKEGKTPAAALRAAQVSLMKEKRWASPFYWAPFTLQGEWR
jgi:CHAT domain-containing protein